MFDVLALSTVEELLAVDVDALGYDELGAAATRLGILLDRVHAKLIEVAVVAEQTNAFVHEPFAASTRDWIQRRTVHHKPQAGADALLARDLIPLDATRAALASGVITVAEARILCRPMRNPRLRRGYHLHEADVLAELLSVPRILWERLMAVIVDRLDQDGPEPGNDPTGSHAHLSRTAAGRWRLDADLDEVGGAELAAVVDTIVRQLRRDARQEGAEAPTTSSLYGEALLELGRRAQQSPEASTNPTVVNVVVSEQTVEHLDDDDHVHEAGCCPPATVDGAPVSNRRLRLLLCHSILRGLVVGTEGAILRLGRTSRDPSPQLRLFLALRDGGCTFPGCSQTPGRCHAHHLNRWTDSGPTDHDNLILVCHRHHALIHSGCWRPELLRDASVLWTHLRTGRRETRDPPRLDPLHPHDLDLIVAT